MHNVPYAATQNTILQDIMICFMVIDTIMLISKSVYMALGFGL